MFANTLIKIIMLFIKMCALRRTELQFSKKTFQYGNQ